MNESLSPAADTVYCYAVLTREGAVQILTHPTAHDLQEYAGQGWRLLRAIETRSDAWQVLQETLGIAVPNTDARIAGRTPEGANPRPPRRAAGGLYPMDLDAWCDWTLD